MKTGIAAVLIALASIRPAAGAGNAVLDTFLEAKNLYKTRKYDNADTVLRRLAELLAAPEYASERPKVLPAYYFYASAVAFERSQEDRARESLHSYFELVPNAALDPSAYPKRFAQFFEVERRKVGQSAEDAAPAPGPQAIVGGVLPDYASFVPESNLVPMNTGDVDWADSAVRFLLSENERKSFRSMGDDDARREWVNTFWKKLDSDPLTSENEFQVEFYRRVQFSDSNFSTEQSKGSLSDRGQVFVVLGPPNLIAKGILRDSDDPMTIARSSSAVTAGVRLAPGEAMVSSRGVGLRSNAKGGVIPGDIDGLGETWIYRADRMLKGMPFNELQFQFFTRKGYGVAVLQKDPRLLQAIGRAVKLLRGAS